MIPITDEARWLMTAGAVAAARFHARGMPVDLPYCIEAQKRLKEDMRRIEADAWLTDEGKVWKTRHGSLASLSDDNQIRDILFNALHLEAPEGSHTKTGRQSVARDTLNELDHPLVDRILEYKKRDKVQNTFLASIIRETVDGKMHPFFHVCGGAKEDGENTVRTYRTSSSDPNFQNMPIRDPEMGPIVRNAIRAPAGWCIVELDYSKIEVHANTWYHKDPTMIQYLVDDHDMHSDMARECYMLSMDEYKGLKPKPKEARNIAKGLFVFANFYGSYWYGVAPSLWKAMRQTKLVLHDGTPLEVHLSRKGINELGLPKRGEDGRIESPRPGTFCRHIMEVEKRFWGVRFAGYDRWKKEWYADYQKKGYFDTLAGFHHEGVFSRNEVISTPGQGTGSHCKMRSIINVTEMVSKNHMRAYPNAEIHDSILGLAPENEVDDYIANATIEMVDRVKAAWPWIITPIGVEAEVSPPGGTWYEKKPRKVV